ncbi:L-histidine N(alpha)-methyltransferase [Palleronia sediminis]|uniref:L-histidine N(Alpha)-methyltransferase n=1 Tax=Palleronia sediminis TaxID=2547833 RepID=A0A4R6AIZ3_9RHOB|nr:L-histidine N(alpha)-methyltransferase [Palleronia sediminis]TDL81363.1 L-histidine N(alpha)-methyltransferase [Palleronia sediminis]
MEDAATRPAADLNRPLLEDALAGLSAAPKTLSPKWLYDVNGSALFEQITGLPEYYPTRAEASILRDRAATLVGFVPPGGALVELGSGASVKTQLLLDAGRHFGAYVPIDISAEFLASTAAGLALRYPDLHIAPVTGDFSGPLSLPDTVIGLPKTAFFPGSTIGNLPPATAQALLRNIRGWPGIEGFLLGVDLVKDTATLVAAYDDAQGVTARFIGNILARLNAEAGADFDLASFDYRASWNADLARIDMALVSTRAQTVTLADTRIAFDAGEAIHVSASRKFTRQSLARLVEAAGWRIGDWFTDADDLFAVAWLTPARESRPAT